MALQNLFAKVQQFWEPKARTKKSKSNVESESQGEVEVAVEPTATADDAEIADQPKEEVETLDGTSTPDSKPAINDEYLAYTLGGELRPTDSPGSLWARSPYSPMPLPDVPEDMDEAMLVERIKQLEC